MADLTTLNFPSICVTRALPRKPCKLRVARFDRPQLSVDSCNVGTSPKVMKVEGGRNVGAALNVMQVEGGKIWQT